MKKFILSTIAIVCISLMSFANTSELKAPLNLELDTVETVNNEEAKKLYWCVAYYSESNYDVITNTTTTTTYYACTEVSL